MNQPQQEVAAHGAEHDVFVRAREMAARPGIDDRQLSEDIAGIEKRQDSLFLIRADRGDSDDAGLSRKISSLGSPGA